MMMSHTIKLLNQISNFEHFIMFKILVEYFLLQALKVVASLRYIAALLLCFDLYLAIIIAA